MSSERLSEVVSARFTPTEAEQLRELAGDGALSHVVRNLTLQALLGPVSRCRPWQMASTSPGSVGSIEVIGDPSVVVHQPAPQGYLEVHSTLAR
jgi:hypothetical protein